MIEILFGDSEAGSMKAAKNKRAVGKKENGPAAVIGSVRKEHIFEKKEVTWIPGSSGEVICLGFMLDIGDIKEAADSPYRRKLICSMLHMEGQENERGLYEEELRRLKAYLEAGEAVRIWYSDAPYARCGLCFACHWMKGYENQIFVVKMPEYRAKETGVVIHHNWGEVSAEEFSYFLRYERELSKAERRMYEILWAELAEENAPLRAVVNGRVIGVETGFYDFLIWQKLTDQPVKEARLIGDILGDYPISVGDWWYASRIEHFISQGRIRVAEDSKHKYARMICRA